MLALSGSAMLNEEIFIFRLCFTSFCYSLVAVAVSATILAEENIEFEASHTLPEIMPPIRANRLPENILSVNVMKLMKISYERRLENCKAADKVLVCNLFTFPPDVCQCRVTNRPIRSSYVCVVFKRSFASHSFLCLSLS